jgi:hypothetical protein
MASEPDGKDRHDAGDTEMTTQTATLKPVADLTPADLIGAYNGKHGCACGCAGRYSYMNAAEGEAKRGYPVSAEEVSPRRVANTLREIQRHIGDEGYEDERKDYGYVAYQSATRLYIAYPRTTS